MNFFQKYRKDKGWTQPQLQEKTGIPKRTWQNWEGGQTTPPTWVIILLEKVKNLF